MRVGRRRFVQGAGAAGLALLVGCGRLPWLMGTESPPKAYRLGFLNDGSPTPSNPLQSPTAAAFLQRLRDHGYIEGQNLTVEYRSPQHEYSRLPDLAAELVALRVDVILAGGTPSGVAAARATSSIPIVTVVGDPVREGLADSYARPGRNVTGLTTLGPTLGPKRLELLKDSIPSAARIGTLWNSNTSVTRVAEFEQIQAASQALDVGLISLEVPNPEEFEAAFEAARHEGADALLVLADTLTLNRSKQIVALVAQSGLPAMYGIREMAQAGGLMAYAPSLTNNMIRAADYVDRLLRGAKPADLPIEQPREFDFAINLKTAQALGLTIPEHVLLQATEVIQ